jgi:hypothetical protein
MYLRRLKKEFRFNQKEILFILATAFITALVITFRKWGETSFNPSQGIENLVVALLLTLLAMFVHVGAQKAYAIRKGISATFKLGVAPEVVRKESRALHKKIETAYTWTPYGLLIGLFLAILTNGWAFILAPGWVIFDTKPIQRLGKWRQRPYFREYGYAVQWGIIANLVLAGIGMGIGTHIGLLLMKINLLIALFTLLPFPTYGGFHIFFVAGIGSTFYQYSWIVSFTLAYSATLYFVGFWWALVIAALFGFLGFLFTFFKLRNMPTA